VFVVPQTEVGCPRARRRTGNARVALLRKTASAAKRGASQQNGGGMGALGGTRVTGLGKA